MLIDNTSFVFIQLYGAIFENSLGGEQRQLRIAIGAADTAGVDLKMMSYALMLGASDFSTPFGYQTNLMVYGPGGYKV